MTTRGQAVTALLADLKQLLARLRRLSFALYEHPSR